MAGEKDAAAQAPAAPPAHAAPEPEPVRYVVVGAVAVIRKNKHERYVNKGGTFTADALDEKNAEHLLNVGLIAVVHE